MKEQYPEKGRRKISTTILREIRQKHRSWQLNSNEKSDLQQYQIESCQPIKKLKKKKKKKKKKTKKTKKTKKKKKKKEDCGNHEYRIVPKFDKHYCR